MAQFLTTRATARWSVLACAAAVLAACGGQPATGTTAANHGGGTTGFSSSAGSSNGGRSSSAGAAAVPSGSVQSSTATGSGAGTAANTWTDSTPRTAIPLGDGKVGASPKAGYVDSCTASFRSGRAQHTGPWIDTAAGTWNAATKVSVQGSVTWPQATHAFTLQGNTRVVTTNDLPVGLPTGTFPIAATDPAFQYDRNPNHIVAQSLHYTLPADPVAAATPSCLGLGPIGVMIDGVALFDALDAAGRDAGAHEIQDTCGGHPQSRGIYHYHDVSSCLLDEAPGTSTLVGYALDGYGIYVERNAQGNLPTDADLGVCHGRTSPVMWNGKLTDIYHYDVTLEYPYTLGCYHGTPVPSHLLAGG